MATTTSRFPEAFPQILVTFRQKKAVEALAQSRSDTQADVLRDMIDEYLANLTTDEAMIVEAYIEEAELEAETQES